MIKSKSVLIKSKSVLIKSKGVLIKSKGVLSLTQGDKGQAPLLSYDKEQECDNKEQGCVDNW